MKVSDSSWPVVVLPCCTHTRHATTQEKLQTRIEDQDCWNLEHRVDTVMGALHLPPPDARACLRAIHPSCFVWHIYMPYVIHAHTHTHTHTHTFVSAIAPAAITRRRPTQPLPRSLAESGGA
jgi:hypothetical protein